jgi:hypothetical protein
MVDVIPWLRIKIVIVDAARFAHVIWSHTTTLTALLAVKVLDAIPTVKPHDPVKFPYSTLPGATRLAVICETVVLV